MHNPLSTVLKSPTKSEKRIVFIHVGDNLILTNDVIVFIPLYKDIHALPQKY